ncbi:MAG: hypothetical protein J0I20_07675 [Chloroflexi bacterium]|nr:hypothetical protein [Chloroflexota bacterium]OJV95295.1 MAG: hypothetical protein BGO39_25180 [Chloroflexi bacterium 54-19]
MAMESENFFEDVEFFSTSLPANGEFSFSGEVTDLHTITFLERLEIEDLETAPSHSNQPTFRQSEAWMLRRIEPVDPVDYLEYHHRIN